MTHLHLKGQLIFQSMYFHFVEFCSYKVLIEFISFANGALRIYNTCLFYCFSLFSISFQKVAVLIFVLLIQFTLEAIGFSLSTGFYILIIVFFIWKLPLWILHCFSHMNITFPMTFPLFFWGGGVKCTILWQPDGKNWLIGKDPDAGKDWGQEEKGATEYEMIRWHHQWTQWTWV